MLANVFSTDTKPFTATWFSATGTVVYSQPYNSFWALAVDEGNNPHRTVRAARPADGDLSLAVLRAAADGSSCAARSFALR
jgi:hypothetical protein